MAAIDATRSPASDISLFAEIEPYATGRIPLDAIHVMQWEACGNPNGSSTGFLHGGPGGGCLPHHRRFYDPRFWKHRPLRPARRGTVDARGRTRGQHYATSGRRSRTSARGISGSSAGWCSADRGGRTLALAYAQAHPDAYSAWCLRGIFLATAAEIDWFMHGMRNVFPKRGARS
jgi:proline iminopeptidase